MPRLTKGLRALFCAVTVALTVPQVTLAQDRAPAVSPILTLESERLIAESAAGRALEENLNAQSSALAAENRRIEAELADEEQDLTTRRASMTAEEFRAAALAFDEKVQALRLQQDQKLRGIQDQYNAARQDILAAADPVLVSIMQESGAVIIMEKTSVLASLQAVDVTGLAIVRLDRAMSGQPGMVGGFDTGTPGTASPNSSGDGPALTPAPEEESQTGSAPDGPSLQAPTTEAPSEAPTEAPTAQD
ncbi:OmpH family outer membrane protein [Pseudooceanicola sp. MF1-13]|uniref:OmpH family outer membrane protein n=1 Tax=Pseudooceanicola sp. MF1-13 TaxID=3379095 RepID=UPI003891D356